jgi:hypothetical protein
MTAAASRRAGLYRFLVTASVLAALAMAAWGGYYLARTVLIERAKDPGLGVRALHGAGWTGQGVAIAMLDGQMRVDHVEYAERLVHYEEFDDFSGLPFERHGPAMASLVVGRTVGTAPGASLHYFAVDFMSPTATTIASAIDYVLHYNAGLPENERIRLLTVSTGFPGEDVTLFDQAIARAHADGVFLLYTNFPIYFVDPVLAIRTLGCAPWKDCSDPEHFGLEPEFVAWLRAEGMSPSELLEARSERDRVAGFVTLYAPGHYRTTAGPAHERHYVYDVGGGDSEWGRTSRASWPWRSRRIRN